MSLFRTRLKSYSGRGGQCDLASLIGRHESTNCFVYLLLFPFSNFNIVNAFGSRYSAYRLLQYYIITRQRAWRYFIDMNCTSS